MEHKVVLKSMHKGLLSHCSFALVNLLYPLSWLHVFIPILPESLKTVTEAPCPFLIGIEDSIMKLLDYLPPEVIEVNLDTNKIDNPSFEIGHPFLPNFLIELKVLIPFTLHQSNSLSQDADRSTLFDYSKEGSIDFMGIRNCFLRYMMAILHNFEDFIVS